MTASSINAPLEAPPTWQYRVGALYVELVLLPDACWAIRQWQGVDACSPVEKQALIGAMAQCLRQADTTLMVDSHRSAAVLQWLLDHGFISRRCKYIYEYIYDGFDETVSFAPLGYKTLAELGEHAFLAYLTTAATDDPDGSAAASPEQEFQELLDHAGMAFRPAQWFVVFDSADLSTAQAVGVLLPQQFADKPSEGTLSYIGVMPNFRQQGYGERLHQLGLALLFSWGVKRYIGSTGQTNLAMQRVFDKNNCKLLGQRHFLTFQSNL